MNKSALTIVIIVVAAVFLSGIGYFLFIKTPPTPTQDQLSITPPTSTPSPQMAEEKLPVKSAAKTCAERVTPVNVGYNFDDPRDYLSPFLNSLKESFFNNDAKETVKCFFDNPDIYTEGNNLYTLNIGKNFSEFAFYINSWTAATGEVNLIITDPEFTKSNVILYTRKIEGQWKILNIKDQSEVLNSPKVITQPAPKTTIQPLPTAQPAHLKLLSPITGETLCLGKTYDIKWTHSNLDDPVVNLFINKGGSTGTDWRLGSFPADFNETGTKGNGLFNWTVGQTENGITIKEEFAYRIRIEGVAKSTSAPIYRYIDRAESGIFSITRCEG